MPSKPAASQTRKTTAKSGASRGELGAKDLDKVVGGLKPATGGKKIIICDPCGGGE